MIVLDTNVVSEILRYQADSLVTQWFDAQPAGESYLCAPVLAELQYGVQRMPPSARQREISRRITTMTSDVFDGRILSFDALAALEYGQIAVEREARGRPITVMDAIIAAIAKSNNATLATRNTADFEQTGIALVNPFDDRNTP